MDSLNEITLQIFLINDKIREQKKMISNTKKMCGLYGPSEVGAIDYSSEKSQCTHISFADGIRLIEQYENNLMHLKDERAALQKRRRKINKIYDTLEDREAQIYNLRVIKKMTQEETANKLCISVRQLQRMERKMRDRGLL